jgi:hypothetical protein
MIFLLENFVAALRSRRVQFCVIAFDVHRTAWSPAQLFLRELFRRHLAFILPSQFQEFSNWWYAILLYKIWVFLK